MKANSAQLSCSRLLRGVFQIDHGGPSAAIPLHLCPAAATACATLSPARTRKTALAITPSATSSHQSLIQHGNRRAYSDSQFTLEDDVAAIAAAPARPAPIRPLPVQCYGCGAFSQITMPDVAGYFDPNRNAVKNYTGTQDKFDPRKSSGYQSQSDIVRASLKSLGNDKLAELGLDPASLLVAGPRDSGFGNCR